MTIEEFQIAAKEIEGDPLKRLSNIAKNVIEKDDYIFDSHMHIFDRKCAPVLYFILRFITEQLKGKDGQKIEVSDINNTVYSILEKEDFVKEKSLDDIELEKHLGQGVKNSDAIKVVLKRDMSEILKYYNENFALNNFEKFKGKDFLSVVLSMDLEEGWGRNVKKTYKGQINELKDISKDVPILPFFAIDPRRASRKGKDNLYQMFIDAFTDKETPFFGVKCYPALGYLPSDARLTPIFEVCEEKNIPIVTHCGGEAVSTYKTSIIVQNSAGKQIELKLPSGDRKIRASYLNDPLHWDSVLSRFPKLKINFAHFGGPSRWSSDFDSDKVRIEQIIDRMTTFGESVYTDFSFNLIDKEANKNLKTQIDKNPLVKSRTMYGTDYWVVLPSEDLSASIQNFTTIMGEDIWDMVYGIPNKFLFGKENINKTIDEILTDLM